jgi:hypothetical protein
MRAFRILGRQSVAMIALLTCFGVCPGIASAQSAVKLSGGGAIDISTEGTSLFSLSGTASHLGKYTCHGEIAFVPGATAGSMNGTGVAVFEAANGDLLVGIVTLELDPNGNGRLAFSWRDSVEFSDETTVYTTGRFVRSRPPGAISLIQYRTNVAIMAILIACC